MRISIDSTVRQLESTMGEFRRQVPFAMALAMNDTMRDVQTKLRNDTFGSAWVNRNRQFPKAATTFYQRATKKSLRAEMGPARSPRTGYLAGEGFLERQRTGETKRPKNQKIAVPKIGPGLRRLKSGSISPAKKPTRNPNLIRIKTKNPRVDLLVEKRKRGKRKLITRYLLLNSAKSSPLLGRYYPDALATIQARLDPHVKNRMLMAIRTAR